jgi:hypothetical protein
MKKIKTIGIKIIYYLIFIPQFSGCYECGNELKTYYEKIPYKNGDIVKYINDDGTIKRDTVRIEYSKVPGNINCSGSEECDENCIGEFTLTLGSYRMHVSQVYDDGSNFIRFKNVFFEKTINGSRLDTSDFVLNGKVIKAMHYKADTSTNTSMKYCYEFYYSVNDYKLIYYTISDNKVFTNWRLFE